MNKTDLLRSVAEVATTEEKKVTMKEVENILSAFEEVVIETISNDIEEKIAFGRLGKFVGKVVPARDGVSAIDGKAWHTDQHNEIAFKMSKTGKMI